MLSLSCRASSRWPLPRRGNEETAGVPGITVRVTRFWEWLDTHWCGPSRTPKKGTLQSPRGGQLCPRSKTNFRVQERQGRGVVSLDRMAPGRRGAGNHHSVPWPHLPNGRLTAPPSGVGVTTAHEECIPQKCWVKASFHWSLVAKSKAQRGAVITFRCYHAGFKKYIWNCSVWD